MKRQGPFGQAEEATGPGGDDATEPSTGRAISRRLLMKGVAAAAAAATGTAILGGPSAGATTRAARSALGRVGSSSASRPNIVIVLTDDQTYESVSASPMPFLSSQPYGHWFVASTFLVGTPLCSPNRATLLTGQFSHHHGVVGLSDGEELDDTSTLATWMQAAGYTTSMIGKYLNAYPWEHPETYIPPGWDDWQVFVDPPKPWYYNYRLNTNGFLETFGQDPADYATDVLASRAVDFVNAHAGDSDPFYMQVCFNAPHSNITPAPRHKDAPVTIPPPTPSYNERDVSDKPAWIQALPRLTGHEQEDRRIDQYRTLLAVDEGVAAIMGALSDAGVLDNTVIFFMTDNGDSYGEHRWIHKKAVYRECVQSPLLIRYPFGNAQQNSQLISTVDIASTVCELAGATPGLPQDGRSMIPLLHGPGLSWRSDVLIEYLGGDLDTDEKAPKFWALQTGQYKYSELVVSGERELYTLKGDPYELKNRAYDPKYASLVATLSERLAILKAS